MLLIMQGLLYCSTKNQEVKFYKNIDKHHFDHGMKGIAQLGDYTQFN